MERVHDNIVELRQTCEGGKMNESCLEAMVHQIAVICRAAEKEQIRPDVLNQIIQSYMVSVIATVSVSD